MKKSQYTAEQIAFVGRQAKTRTLVPGYASKMGICEESFYLWNKKYLGMVVPEVKRLPCLSRRTGNSSGWCQI